MPLFGTLLFLYNFSPYNSRRKLGRAGVGKKAGKKCHIAQYSSYHSAESVELSGSVKRCIPTIRKQQYSFFELGLYSPFLPLRLPISNIGAEHVLVHITLRVHCARDLHFFVTARRAGLANEIADVPLAFF